MSIDTTTPRTGHVSESIAIEIGVWLVRRRMSQSKLAKALDKSPMWVSDRMTGRVKIGADDLEEIARALGVNIVDLLPLAERSVTVADPWMPHRPPVSRPPGRVDATRPARASPAAPRRPAW